MRQEFSLFIFLVVVVQQVQRQLQFVGQFVSQGFKSSIISSGSAVQRLIYIINIDSMDLGLAGWCLCVPRGRLSSGFCGKKSLHVSEAAKSLATVFTRWTLISIRTHSHIFTGVLAGIKWKFPPLFHYFLEKGKRFYSNFAVVRDRKQFQLKLVVQESYEYAKKIAITCAAGGSHSDLL